jgi:hypothetical protein
VATSTQDTCERFSTAEPSGPAAPAPADGQQQQQQQQQPQRKQCEEGIFAGDISRWWQDLNTGLTQVYETARASAA